MHRLIGLGLMSVLLHPMGYSAHQGDTQPLYDPMRPVMEVGRDYVVLQYHTRTPTETRVQIRQSNLPMTAWRPEGKRADPWQGAGVRIVDGEPGKRTYHRLRISGLQPGKRYYYRIYDPDLKPTLEERKWGASPPWRREYAVATLAPQGYKTIVRLPVKVLLMPNVVNVASAYQDPDNPAPPPAPMSEAELARIREEYAIAAQGSASLGMTYLRAVPCIAPFWCCGLVCPCKGSGSGSYGRRAYARVGLLSQGD